MDRELSKKVIFCSPRMNRATEKLLISLFGFVEDAPLELYRQTHLLKHRLLGPKTDISSAVLMVTSVGELEALMPLKPLLEGIPVILILPDSSAETIAMGHRFAPRFLISNGDNLQDVARVVINIHNKFGVNKDAA